MSLFAGIDSAVKILTDCFDKMKAQLVIGNAVNLSLDLDEIMVVLN